MSEKTVIAEKDGQQARFVESAFRKVWEERGWTLVEDESSGNVAPAQKQQVPQQPDTSGTGNTQNTKE